MKVKTFREYLTENRFEDIWAMIVTNFLEPENIKPVYGDYFEKLKALPYKQVKGQIEISSIATQYPKGIAAAPDWLIDKKSKPTKEIAPQLQPYCFTGLLCIPFTHRRSMMTTLADISTFLNPEMRMPIVSI